MLSCKRIFDNTIKRATSCFYPNTSVFRNHDYQYVIDWHRCTYEVMNLFIWNIIRTAHAEYPMNLQVCLELLCEIFIRAGIS